MVRSTQTNLDPTPIEVLDLTTGEVLAVDLGPAAYVYSAELSPDNESLAVYLDGEVRVVDLDTGAVTTVHRQPRFLDSHEFAPGQGWSPDGRRLAVHNEADLLVMDAGGELQEVLAGVHLVNGSQSWSPDGRSVLGYDQHANAFEVVPVGGGEPRVLDPPDGAARPLGWAGDRVVWLAGEPGAQQLVTADGVGEVETWVRFEVGDLPVESVTWSRDLSAETCRVGFGCVVCGPCRTRARD